MTGVIYARYSSDNQREESIEGQICENTVFAEKNGNIYRYYKCASAKRHECDKKPFVKSGLRSLKPRKNKFSSIFERADKLSQAY